MQHQPREHIRQGIGSLRQPCQLFQYMRLELGMRQCRLQFRYNGFPLLLLQLCPADGRPCSFGAGYRQLAQLLLLRHNKRMVRLVPVMIFARYPKHRHNSGAQLSGRLTSRTDNGHRFMNNEQRSRPKPRLLSSNDNRRALCDCFNRS
ncbi:hypothetical protein D3C78_1515320 [compost metagenome]